jgi:hypothetical protein
LWGGGGGGDKVIGISDMAVMQYYNWAGDGGVRYIKLKENVCTAHAKRCKRKMIK